MKQLQLNFLSSTNKKHRLTLSDINESLGADEIKTQMSRIAQAALFEFDGEALYAKPQSANFVEQIITPVFTDRDEQVQK